MHQALYVYDEDNAPLDGATVETVVVLDVDGNEMAGIETVTALGSGTGAYVVEVDDADIPPRGVIVALRVTAPEEAIPRLFTLAFSLDGSLIAWFSTTDGETFEGGPGVFGVYKSANGTNRTAPAINEYGVLGWPGIFSAELSLADRTEGVVFRIDAPTGFEPDHFDGTAQPSEGGGGDVNPPTITQVSPAPGSAISRNSPITIQAQDDMGFRRVIAYAKFPGLTTWELVFDGESFAPNYSTSTSILSTSGGIRTVTLTIRRDNGWPFAPTLNAIFIDLSGNEG